MKLARQHDERLAVDKKLLNSAVLPYLRQRSRLRGGRSGSSEHQENDQHARMSHKLSTHRQPAFCACRTARKVMLRGGSVTRPAAAGAALSSGSESPAPNLSSFPFSSTAVP